MSNMHQTADGVSAQVAAKLAELQGDRTDAEFAALLGITRGHWSHIRAGRRQASYAFIKRVAQMFPDLYPIVMRDLTAGAAEAVVS